MKKIGSLEDVKSLNELISESDCDIPTSSPRLRSETVADSLANWADASQTLVFLDWDDTLFPTTELFDNWGLSKKL